MKTKKLIKILRNDPQFVDSETMAEAANRLELLSVELKKTHAKLVAARAERDAAIADLERAEEKAEEAGAFLDTVIHPICDYSVYTEGHDLVSDIVHWEHDDVWRGATDTNVGSKKEDDVKC